MKRIVIKIIISVAVGLIVGQIAGNINSKRTYYILNSSLTKKEVSKEKWESTYYDVFEGVRKKRDRLEPENVFNTNSFYSFGIISMCGIAIVLLVGELRNTNNS